MKLRTGLEGEGLRRVLDCTHEGSQVLGLERDELLPCGSAGSGAAWPVGMG